MISMQKLKSAVRDGLAILKREPSLIEGAVYASANRRVVGRLVYAHHFPSQGLQEPKSDDDFGVSVQGYFKRNGEKVVGFGQIANDVSPDAVQRALKRAKANAVLDPDFHGFPEPARERPETKALADPSLLNLTPEREAKLLADISWKTLEGAFKVFERYRRAKGAIADPDFIVSGDNFLVTERMAMASTKGMLAAEENAVAMNLTSAMVERAHAKGRGWRAAPSLRRLLPAETGAFAARQAISGIGGERLPTGSYAVVFGPQAATEIFANLLLASFSAAALDFRLSLFPGKFGKPVASPLLSLYDDATFPGGAASKAVTDEGYATARVPLIEAGRFVGLLQNDYYRKKLLAETDKALNEKIGAGAREYLKGSPPRSGFRFGMGGGRVAAREPGISATNLFIASPEPCSRAELLKRVKDGVYIGSLWYTYPIAGYTAGEISGTAVADTYRIRNGRIAEPLRVNGVRIKANLRDMVKNIIGITRDPVPTILWASDEITYAPEVGIADIHCEEIRHDEA